MSDNLSQEEIDALVGQSDLISELDPLKDVFNSCLNDATEILSSITNLSPVTFGEPKIDTILANEFSFDNGEIAIQIGLKNGLSGYGYINISKEDSETIVSSMMGTEDHSSLSDDIIHNALSKAMDKTMGNVCAVLSKSLNDSVDTTTPDIILSESANLDTLFNGAFKSDTKICRITYDLILGTVSAKMIFVFILNTAKSASFKVKATNSKNLLRLNPNLAKSVAEFFTLLGIKYKAIYSMIGVMDNVSVLDLNPIHSLQCLDVTTINNYNIINKNKEKDLYNVFLFEKSFVSDVKKDSGLLDDEESTWEILKELNNQFSYIFLEYCSDNDLTFDDIECNNFLELPDNQYLLVSYSVGNYKFYQLLSFELIDKINKNFSSSDRAQIDAKTIENLTKEGYNSESLNEIKDKPSDLNDIPNIFKKLPFEVSAELGEKIYTIKDLLHLSNGYIIHFNKKVSEDIDICINNVKKAEGEVGQLTYNKSNNYAVKIKKIIKE